MEYLQTAYRVGQRRACRVVEAPRASVRYRSVADPQEELRVALRDVAMSRPGYGYRRVQVLLERQGWRVNHKRVYRLYRREGLALRRKPPKRRVSAKKRGAPGLPTSAHQTWTMDFLADRLYDGRPLRVLAVMDVFSRTCVALRARHRFRAEEVTAVLESVKARYGTPRSIRVDNGAEFTSRILDLWAYGNGVDLDFNRPGKPTDNAFIESFNSRLRQECLNQHWFMSAADAQGKLEAWREEYNERRPHGSLGNRSPSAFLAILGASPSAPLQAAPQG